MDDHETTSSQDPLSIRSTLRRPAVSLLNRNGHSGHANGQRKLRGSTNGIASRPATSGPIPRPAMNGGPPRALVNGGARRPAVNGAARPVRPTFERPPAIESEPEPRARSNRGKLLAGIDLGLAILATITLH